MTTDKQRERARYDVRGVSVDTNVNSGPAKCRAVSTEKHEMDLMKEELAGMKSNVKSCVKLSPT